MGCGTSFVKYALFLCNLIFALCGLAILGIGVAFKLKVADITRLLEGKIEAPPLLFIIIGCVIFVIAFFGCCGAVRESHCMVVTYAVFLLIIIIVQVVIAILVFVYIGDLEKAISESLRGAFEEVKSGSEPAIEAFNSLQSQLHCCGLQGPFDYPLNGVPNSCCTNGEGDVVRTVLGSCQAISAYKSGCIGALTAFTKTAGKTIGGVAIGVAVAEVIGAIFALCLANHIRNADRRYA